MKRMIAIILSILMLIQSSIVGQAKEYETERFKTASAIEGIYTISTKLDSSKLLDIHGVSKEPGARVELYQNNGGKNQKFAIREEEDGYYSITAMHSGLLLTADGSKVCQSNPTGNTEQKWRIVENSDGSYTFYLSDTTKCMDIPESKAVNGISVDVFEHHGGNNQKFILGKLEELPEDNQPDNGKDEEETIELLKDGIYTISTKLDSSKLLDVHGVSKESGAGVEL